MKIGLIGTGHLGKIHLNCIQSIPEYQFVGFYDRNPEVASTISGLYRIPMFEDPLRLMDAVDIVDIVTPTTSHFEIASKAIRKGKHVFVEKPMTSNIEEARTLISLANEAHVKHQVGFVERFNPAFMCIASELEAHGQIEAVRHAPFNPRGLDVSVVLDLMIHDIDLVLHTVKSPIKSIHANGISILGPTEDVARARIEFYNGSVANLSASRIAETPQRSFSFYSNENNRILQADLLEKKAWKIQYKDNPEGLSEPLTEEYKLEKRSVFVEKQTLPVENHNAIQEELRSFLHAILRNEESPVPFTEGYKALETAIEIMNLIQSNR